MWGAATKLIELLGGNHASSVNNVFVAVVVLVIAAMYSGLPYLEGIKPVHAADLQKVIQPMQDKQDKHGIAINRMLSLQYMKTIHDMEQVVKKDPTNAAAIQLLQQTRFDYDTWKREVGK